VRLVALVALFGGAAAVACGGGGAAPKPVAPKGPAIDPKVAEKDARGLVGEVYATIGRGDTKDGLFTLLAQPLVVLGPRKNDAFVTRADALVALQAIIDPRTKTKTPIKSGALEVVASAGGRSAWAFDVVGAGPGEPLAMMAILSNADDIWIVDAVAMARMPAGATIKAESTKDAVVPPGAGAKSKIDPNVGGAVDRFRKGLIDQQSWGDDLISRSDSIVVGPAAGEITRGKADIKKLWKKRVDTNVRLATSGEITALSTSDGQLAWVSAPVTRVGDGQDPLPLRAFAIFERAGDNWKMIALQESAAVDAPGSGTAWKKIVPPKPEPKPIELPPEKVAKGKKVKKGSTGKPVDEDKKAKKDDPKKKIKKSEADDDEDTKSSKTKLASKKKAADDEDETPKKKKFAKALDSDETQSKKAKKASDDDESPKKKKLAKSSSDDEESPKKSKKKSSDDEESPKKSKKKSSDDDDESPKKSKKSKKASADDEESPKKSKKKSSDDEESPKKSKKASSDDDESPKKSKKKSSDDEESPKKSKKKPSKDDDDDIKINDD
jgi:ketosteroid isomerase-like protein